EYGQTADEFGNQPEGQDIVDGGLAQQLAFLIVLQAGVVAEANRLASQTLADNVFEPHERAAANKQDIRGIDLNILLLGVFTTALGGHVGDGAFEHLQERLLHALARNVARNRDVLAGFADLVDL